MGGKQGRQRRFISDIAGCQFHTDITGLIWVTAYGYHVGALCLKQLYRGKPDARGATKNQRFLSR
jgi:hypothetical protein